MAYQGNSPEIRVAVAAWLRGWICKVSGVVMLAGCAAGTVSLLTWSAADPSLTHATSGSTHNLLGPIGAIIADLLMQMVGLAGIFAFLPPAFWALQLLSTQRIVGLRAKLASTPIAVILLSAALASLPPMPTWPLHHNYGGVLGDLALDMLASLLLPINPDRAWPAAGLFYLAAGLLVLFTSLGLSQRDLQIMWQRGPKQGWRGVADAGRTIRDFLVARRQSLLVAASVSGGAVTRSAMSQARRLSPFADKSTPQDLHSQHLSERPQDKWFDDDADSRAMAVRFAPKGSDAHAATVKTEPRLPLQREQRPRAPAYRSPPHDILKRAPNTRAQDANAAVLQDQAVALTDVLADFGIRGEIKDVQPGPAVTLFEFEPARGLKTSRVVALAEDIARSMHANCARVAVIPGSSTIGIELPNARRETVYLRELFESDVFHSSDATLPLVLGKSINGTPVFADLVRMPHLLVAGTTGSGKSVGINAMILSLLHRLSPDQCRFLMIDPKMLELSVYNGIPHLLAPVVTDARKAVAALDWVVGEMEDRYQRMASLSVRNIEIFNGRVRTMRERPDYPASAGPHGALTPMPYIVVVVDEFADLMVVAGKEIEASVQRLTQMARAAGIHLIMATQRPSVDVITGTIKANFPTRISFKVASKIDSRTILNEQGAEQLLGQGDMLFSTGAGRTLRVHGPFVSDEEVENIASYLRQQGEPNYIDVSAANTEPEVGKAPPGRSVVSDLYDRAVAIVLGERKTSTSYLQRRLGVGYNRAADLIERMEREGVISAPGHQGRRHIVAYATASG
jgi:DNA segregation ATPase FtsK/SpoIIIE, S-DNA-T family